MRPGLYGLLVGAAHDRYNGGNEFSIGIRCKKNTSWNVERAITAFMRLIVCLTFVSNEGALC
jgi:hypothetical protein